MMQALPETQPEVVCAGAAQPPRGIVLLVRRAALIMALLLIYRLGTFIPVPGVDWAWVNRVFSPADHLPGALTRGSVLALGLLPYITASVFIQLLIWLVPGLGRKTATRAGRKQIGLYIRLLTVPVAVFQANMIAMGLRSSILDPIAANWLALVATMTAGTMFLVWLSDQITKLEFGDGVLLILAADIVADIPRSAIMFYRYVQTHNVPPGEVIAWGALMFAILAGMVFVELARRRISILYPQGSAKRSSVGNSYLSLKINNAGIVPLLFASMLLAPLTAYVAVHERGPEWLGAFTRLLRPGQPLYETVITVGIVFFTFCLAPAIWPPRAAANDLERSGAFIPSIQPGRDTADYIACVLTRITVPGAVYLAAVYLLPWILLLTVRDLPFNLRGFSLLAVMIAAVDILRRLGRAELAVPR